MEMLMDLQFKDNLDEQTNNIRPPYLWNYPKAIETHKFRSIANPKDSYIDGRFEDLDVVLD